MRFEYPWVLALILLLPFFHRWWRNRNAPARVRSALPFPKEVRSVSPAKILLGLKYFALSLAIVALARPQFSFRQTERQVSGVDIVMTMDVSASMNIEDMSDKSRLDIAKRTMEAFVRGRSNDRIGFVIFSGEALTLVPPTLDYGLLMKSMRDVELGLLRDGTAIGDGLSVAVNRLRGSKAKSRVIILLTDGDSNIGQVDPLTAGDMAAGYGIKVYTIAIGREGRVKLPIRRQGMMGNTITTYQWMDNALNTGLLEKIAAETRGKFYRVQDEQTLDRVFGEIDRLEKTQIQTSEKVHYDEVFQKPLMWALLLLVLERLASLFWVRVLP